MMGPWLERRPYGRELAEALRDIARHELGRGCFWVGEDADRDNVTARYGFTRGGRHYVVRRSWPIAALAGQLFYQMLLDWRAYCCAAKPRKGRLRWRPGR